MALKIADLEITGTDLITELKLNPGKLVGEILKYLLDKVIDDPNLNNKQMLLELAKTYVNN